jgi:hypothetical protein
MLYLHSSPYALQRGFRLSTGGGGYFYPLEKSLASDYKGSALD